MRDAALSSRGLRYLLERAIRKDCSPFPSFSRLDLRASGARPGNINRRGTSMTKQRVSLTLDDRLVSKIDEERGLAARSTFINEELSMARKMRDYTVEGKPVTSGFPVNTLYDDRGQEMPGGPNRKVYFDNRAPGSGPTPGMNVILDDRPKQRKILQKAP